MKRNSHKERQIPSELAYAVAGIAAAALFTAAYAARHYPLIGVDYAYFLPRLLDTHLHERLNGLTVQWFTPGFGGGLPAFGNPQHVQYSLPQFLVWIAGPFPAVLLASAMFIAVGYASTFRLATRVVGLTPAAAHATALCFSLNGFNLNHTACGHVGFVSFPLAALIVLTVADRTLSLLLAVLVFSVSLSAMIFTAGFYLAVITVLTGAVVLPLLYVVAPNVTKWPRALLVCAVGGSLATALLSAKICAVACVMEQFPRVIAADTSSSPWARLAGLPLTVSAGSTLLPGFLLAGQPVERFPKFLMRHTGWRGMFWEVDSSLSFLVFVVIGSAVWTAIRRGTLVGRFQAIAASRPWALIALFCGVAVAVQFTIAAGPIYELSKPWPVLRSLHNNSRFAASFLLPLALSGGLAFDAIVSRHLRTAAHRWVTLGMICLSMMPYWFLLPGQHMRTYDARSIAAVFSEPITPASTEVTAVVNDSRWMDFSPSQSNLFLYEPLFGYNAERFTPRAIPGPAGAEFDGALNMTNPLWLAYGHRLNPGAWQSLLFQRFTLAESEECQAFCRRLQPAWWFPEIQRRMNVISRWALVVHVIGFALTARHARRASRQERDEHG